MVKIEIKIKDVHFYMVKSYNEVVMVMNLLKKIANNLISTISEKFETVTQLPNLQNTNSSKSPFKGKIIRDPLHDLIEVDCPFALEIINSKAMQRLRKIRQLGLAYQVYPGAEHSRFTHSLGVYHIANQAVDLLNSKSLVGEKAIFDEHLKRVVTLAALMHDIGHGAFSHLFEHVSKTFLSADKADHENWTIRVLEQDKEISTILNKAGVLNDIKEVILHTYKPHFVVELISSQLDVDRFDYLLRDSLMTGAKYGNFDLPWILRNLRIADHDDIKVLAIDGRRGLSAVEGYILGRHYMYKHVYYHKTIRAAEKMLSAILRRAVELTSNMQLDNPHPVLISFANNKNPELEDYLSLNDFLVLSWIEDWAKNSNDEILKDLCDKFVRREIFGAIIPKVSKSKEYSKLENKLKDFIKSKNLSIEYYLLEDDASDIAFKNYYYFLEKNKEKDSQYQEIYYTIDDKGTIKELSGSNTLMVEAKNALNFSEERWYIPKHLLLEAKKVLDIE